MNFKCNKSLNNYIGIDESPKDIYGKKKESSEFIKQEVIVGVKEVNDYQVFREVIQQTLAKLSKD